VQQAADDKVTTIDVEQIRKLFSDTGIEATASGAGEPENFDTY
jgi:hypothetical protein